MFPHIVPSLSPVTGYKKSRSTSPPYSFPLVSSRRIGRWGSRNTILPIILSFRVPPLSFRAEREIFLYHSTLKSSQFGFIRFTNWFFFSLRHFFISFSLVHFPPLSFPQGKTIHQLIGYHLTSSKNSHYFLAIFSIMPTILSAVLPSHRLGTPYFCLTGTKLTSKIV